jgi:cytochrome c peroxidase
MGVGEENLGKKSAEIGSLPEYKEDFDNVFPADGATPGTIAQALASYERTLFCGDTAWDRFMTGQSSALTPEQKQGWELFKGKAACNACHVPPFFSDAYLSQEGAFHNNGIGIEGKKESEDDIGRMKVTSNPSDWALFKTPSLRNVSKSAPYFHNGAMTKLEDAVRFMAKGGYKNKNRDSRLVDKQLTDQEITAIVSFLGSLECSGKLELAR